MVDIDTNMVNYVSALLTTAGDPNTQKLILYFSCSGTFSDLHI